MPLLIAVTVISMLLSLAAAFVALHGIHAPIPVIGDFFSLTLSKNTGIAFSIKIGSPWQEILIVAALIGVTFVAIRSKHNRIETIAFGLILGGAFGNLIDRMIHGFVTDFIAVGTFPIFNVADSCITIGAVMLIAEGLLKKKK